MKDTQVIDVLYIALLEVQRCAIFFSGKVQCVQCLRLGFRDRGDIGRPWLCEVASKIATSILDQNPFRTRCCGWLMVQKGSVRVWLLGIVESARSVFVGYPALAKREMRGTTYPSTGQPCDKVWIKSGRSLARML